MRIFIVTSDVTGWMLRACLWLLDRHWPQHPPVVVGGYTRPQLPPHVQFVPIGEFSNYPANRWSNGVLQFLEMMPDDVFLWTMDDFWLCQDVDGPAVQRLYHHLLESDHLARIDLTADRLNSGHARPAGYLDYVSKTEGGVKFVNQVDLVLTPPETPYQLSFQTGLWRRRALIQYMTPGETPAEAEIRGADRMSRAGANVLGTRQAPFKYLIAMQHGKLHLDDSGYQVPPVALLPDDKAELARLGYLAPERLPV